MTLLRRVPNLVTSGPTCEWWTRYDQQGASSRYRVYQYLGKLHAYGWNAQIHPLGAPRSDGALTAVRIGCRLMQLARAAVSSPSHVAARIIQKELILPPYLAPNRILRRSLRLTPTVWDIDDAVWCLDSGRYRQAIELAAGCEEVVAGNSILADWATSAGAQEVALIPTCYSPSLPVNRVIGGRDTPTVTIGWIGSPWTATYLHDLAPLLRELLLSTPDVRFLSVGASLHRALQEVPNAEALAWSPSIAERALSEFDIGLAPIRRGCFEDGKCGFKIVQYMAHGVVPIAADTPAHREIVSDSGILVPIGGDWASSLLDLLKDTSLRSALSRRAQRRAEQHFSVDSGAALWNSTLRRAAGLVSEI